MRTTNPILSPAEREIVHELDSSRALIMRRLATRDDFWAAGWRFVPGGPIPQPVEFGRALDRERIQDAPEPPSKWRDIGVVMIGLTMIWLALIGLFVALRWALSAIGAIG